MLHPREKASAGPCTHTGVSLPSPGQCGAGRAGSGVVTGSRSWQCSALSEHSLIQVLLSNMEEKPCQQMPGLSCWSPVASTTLWSFLPFPCLVFQVSEYCSTTENSQGRGRLFSSPAAGGTAGSRHKNPGLETTAGKSEPTLTVSM